MMKDDIWTEQLAASEFQVIWKHVTFTAYPGTKQERVIIQDVSGHLQSGRLMAFLGPSGSGKSTLLECIVKKRRTGVQGSVQIRTSQADIGNDSTIDANNNLSTEALVAYGVPNSKQTKNNSLINMSFIPQKDDLFDLLTVRESILFATRLQIAKKLHDNAPLQPVTHPKTGELVQPNHRQYCSALCDQIVQQLGLQDVAENRLSACSGGQRKRVSIGQELPSRPRVILLDEPTSGLDSNSSYTLVSLLSELCKATPSIAVMLSIHQPSVKLFSVFDLAYVLARGGRCIYQGRTDRLVQHLATFDLHCPPYSNVADYAMELANLEHDQDKLPALGAMQQQNFERNIRTIVATEVYDYERLTAAVNMSSKNSQRSVITYPNWTHTWQLTERSLLITIRDPLVFGLRFLSHLVVGVFFALFYGPDIGSRGGCSPEIGQFEPQKLDYMTDEIETELRYTYDNIGAILFSLVFTAFSAIMPICIAFPLEVRIFMRERSNAWYSLRSYFLGRTLSELPFQLVMPTMFAGSYYILSSQPPEFWRMANFIGFCVLSTLIGQSFGYVMGAVFMENITTALFFGPVTTFPPIMLSGTLLKLSTSPFYVRLLSWFSYFRWAASGMITSVYGFARCGQGTNELLKANREAFHVWLAAMLGVYNEPEAGSNSTSVDAKPSEKFVTELVNTITDPFISKGNRIQSLAMNEFDLIDEDLYISWFALLVYFFASRVFVYYVLRYKTSKSEI